MDIDLPTEKGGPGEAAINAASIKMSTRMEAGKVSFGSEVVV